MYIIFDTETTGLPKHRNAPVEDVENWPRIVQIAWACYDGKRKHISTKSFLVKPQGFVIPREAQRVHGISTSKARIKGKLIRKVLQSFSKDIQKSNVIIAHNLEFDEKVVHAEFIRAGLSVPFGRRKRVCTMIETTNFCAIPGYYGNFKWPSLKELHDKLFRADFSDAHDAKADVETCAKCYFELRKRRVIH